MNTFRRVLLKLAPLAIFLFALVTVLFSALPAPTVAQVSPRGGDRSEIRGVWITNVDSAVLFDRAVLQDAMQQLGKLNFNTIYPVVWNWGYTSYPSQVAKRAVGAAFDPRPYGLDQRDALAELVQHGHKQGITVMPWFEFGFMTPEDSALALRHPDWLTQRLDGTQTWQEGIYPRVWLNPFKPEVQQFIFDLILEIVTQYNIDGIQFDDHFGLPYEFGYDDYTVQLYRQEHQGKAPPNDPKDPEWMRWRANKITAFLQKVFRAIKDRKNEVVIGLSPNNYSFSYNHSLQDWNTWRQQGLIEELVLQVYRDDVSSFVNELKAPEFQAARQHIPTGVGILTGLKRKPVPIQQIQNQVQAVRSQGFTGVSFFFYETMWSLTAEPAAVRKAAFQKLFPTPVAHPNLFRGWTPPR